MVLSFAPRPVHAFAASSSWSARCRSCRTRPFPVSAPTSTFAVSSRRCRMSPTSSPSPPSRSSFFRSVPALPPPRLQPLARGPSTTARACTATVPTAPVVKLPSTRPALRQLRLRRWRLLLLRLRLHRLRRARFPLPPLPTTRARAVLLLTMPSDPILPAIAHHSACLLCSSYLSPTSMIYVLLSNLP